MLIFLVCCFSGMLLSDLQCQDVFETNLVYSVSRVQVLGKC